VPVNAPSVPHLLDWSADLRAMPVPPNYRQLFNIASEMADALLEQFREFIDRSIEKLDGLPLALRQQRPVTMDLVFAIKLDKRVQQRFSRRVGPFTRPGSPCPPPHSGQRPSRGMAPRSGPLRRLLVAHEP
jgi:hypothetical protein